MLVSIGSGRDAPDDVVELLLACHGRIRSFVDLAQLTSSGRELPDAEVAQACARIERYFVEALPLHVADEEQSILPRLLGQEHEVDRALLEMRAQHGEHESPLRALLESIRSVRLTPAEARHRDTLASTAERVSRAFTEHLALEESIIVPAMRRLLTPEAQREVLREMRARRA